MSDALAMEHGGDEVIVTMPAGWQVVHLARLLDLSVPSAISAAVGDEPDSESALALENEFAMLRERVVSDGVILLALRSGRPERSIDTMTIAVKPVVHARGESLAGDATETERDQAADGEASLGAFGDVPVLMHRSTCERPSGASATGSYMQLLRLLPDGKRGAVVTLTSTAMQQEDSLLQEAALVASSFAERASVAEPSLNV